ncbi:MAG TPA: DNA polymerase III subunit delta [Hyphomicrobiaceae bacterium]|nr:DNA polymerase III subunit delta [Hyphomicrobiaceae bacterium]
MVAIKAHQAQAFLKSMDAAIAAVLVYGNDAGLVSERARAAAERLAGNSNPPGEIVRIEEADFEQDPERLAVELKTVAMFGGRRIVRTTAGRKINAQVLTPLLAPGAMAGALVVEAGNLRQGDALRAAFERADHAVAIPCYGDEVRDLDRLVREALAAQGVEITAEARQALLARLGADRALSRSEIEKVALYAGDKGRVEVDDVDAVVGDAAELAIDAVLFAAASGDAARAMSEFDRTVASGESPQAIILALQRHFQRLNRIRAALDAGRGFEDAIRPLRPPVHFKHKGIVETQARAWTLARSSQALAMIAAAARAARLTAALEAALAERLVLDLVRLAPRPRPTR